MCTGYQSIAELSIDWLSLIFVWLLIFKIQAYINMTLLIIFTSLQDCPEKGYNTLSTITLFCLHVCVNKKNTKLSYYDNDSRKKYDQQDWLINKVWQDPDLALKCYFGS